MVKYSTGLESSEKKLEEELNRENSCVNQGYDIFDHISNQNILPEINNRKMRKCRTTSKKNKWNDTD